MNKLRSTVYLTHVKWVTGKTQLEKYFSRFGKVQDVLLFFVSLNSLLSKKFFLNAL